MPAVARVGAAFRAVAPERYELNVSNRQLVQPSFARDVDAALAESEIDPRSLQLEITESALIGNVAAVGAVLAGLRKRGVNCVR